MIDYQDIINLPHHTSPSRERMSLRNRAAQFAPFSALSGYEESIAEEGRETEVMPSISDEEMIYLNEQLRYLKEHRYSIAEVTYFIKDAKKEGGRIVTKTAPIKRVDDILGVLIFEDGIKVSFVDIINIKTSKFSDIPR